MSPWTWLRAGLTTPPLNRARAGLGALEGQWGLLRASPHAQCGSRPGRRSWPPGVRKGLTAFSSTEPPGPDRDAAGGRKPHSPRQCCAGQRRRGADVPAALEGTQRVRAAERPGPAGLPAAGEGPGGDQVSARPPGVGGEGLPQRRGWAPGANVREAAAGNRTSILRPRTCVLTALRVSYRPGLLL